MNKSPYPLLLATALLAASTSLQAAIESDFDDLVYPGAASDGWTAEWMNPPAAVPQILTENPLDAGSPYVRLGMTGTTGRNLMRQYQSGAGVDVTQPHVIRWKFRLVDPGFLGSFTVFNDRVHFFGRNGARLTASTDAADSWAIMATGDAHSSGAAAGQTFWIYDNLAGDGAFNPGNHVDSLVPILPDNIYAFEVVVIPSDQSYTVSIRDETSGASFTSGAPHKFRDLSATGLSHTLIHFGVQTSAGDLSRGFDLDSVSIEQASLEEVPPQIVNLVPEPNAFHDATQGLRFEVVSAQPIPVAGITLSLNGLDVSANLTISGDATHRIVTYGGLAADQIYTAEITATNPLGTASTTFQFNTTLGRTTLFDAGGFDDPFIYLEGPLFPDSNWAPAGQPAEIVNLLDGDHGKVLRREQTGSDNTDILTFAPGATVGTLTIRFDARVMETTRRTLDVMLLPSSGGQMASMLGWGINAGKVAYFDGSAWVSIADLDTEWHSFEMVNYLSGPLAKTWDFKMDGEVIGRSLPWRNAIADGTTLSRLRLGAIRGTAGDIAEIDNLAVFSEPEPTPPPVIANIVPAHRTHFYAAANGLRFESTSEEPILSDGISLVLNGTDVSDQLTISGQPTQRAVEFNGLEPDQVYTADIRVANVLGENAITVQFDTISQSTAIVDVDGFEASALYPLGNLMAVTDDHGTWTPGRTGTPAQIADAGAPHGRVLRRAQTGDPNIDLLDFPPFTAGLLTIAFDARVSTTGSRTLDVALNRTGQDQRAGSVAWGAVPGRLAYESGGTWTDFADLDDQWHHYELVNYLDGPRGQSFDVRIDGVTVAEALPWNSGFSLENAVFGRLRIGAEGGAAGDSGDIDNLVITVTPPPPGITGLVPAALSVFHPAANGLLFQVVSASGLTADNVQVVLNGNEVSDALVFSGNTVTYDGLRPQTFYVAEITVTAATGTTRLVHQFATFQSDQAVTVEAEDYNYGGGQFQNDPLPSGYRTDGTKVNGNGVGYVDLAGTEGIDYSITSPPNGSLNEIYRFADEVGTRYSLDATRQKYTAANVPDYEVWGFQTGDWMNYTRTFDPGPYQVFLRAASTQAQTIRLDRVTGNATSANQTTAALGVFNIPNTGNSYTYAPLTDIGGQIQTIDLSGAQTVRLTGANANAGLDLNFLLFLAAPDLPIEIVLMNPALTASGFTLSFVTDSGQSYTVEFSADLRSLQWTAVQTITGTGSVASVTDPAPADSHRFYRVRLD